MLHFSPEQMRKQGRLDNLPREVQRQAAQAVEASAHHASIPGLETFHLRDFLQKILCKSFSTTLEDLESIKLLHIDADSGEEQRLCDLEISASAIDPFVNVGEVVRRVYQHTHGANGIPDTVYVQASNEGLAFTHQTVHSIQQLLQRHELTLLRTLIRKNLYILILEENEALCDNVPQLLRGMTSAAKIVFFKKVGLCEFTQGEVIQSPAGKTIDFCIGNMGFVLQDGTVENVNFTPFHFPEKSISRTRSFSPNVPRDGWEVPTSDFLNQTVLGSWRRAKHNSDTEEDD